MDYFIYLLSRPNVCLEDLLFLPRFLLLLLLLSRPNVCLEDLLFLSRFLLLLFFLLAMNLSDHFFEAV